jgi:hypothetical protein
LLLSILPIGIVAYGADLVAINAVNFPDPVWRNSVAAYYDDNGDGYLSASERSASTVPVGGMVLEAYGDDVDNVEIKDLKGIEYFTNLKRLRAGGVGLTTLDLSMFPELLEITLEGNELQSLDLSANTKLEWVNVASNALTQLILPTSDTLVKLSCQANHLTEINVDSLSKLTELRCYQNELNELDLSFNPFLTTLSCSNNHIAELDLSTNTMLESVTKKNIGEQTVSATAKLVGQTILVPYTFEDSSRFVTSSLASNDDDDTGYDGSQFVAYSVHDIENGITYHYSTGFTGTDDAEDMDVTIDVARDFYQVDYYVDSTMDDVIKYEIVEQGASVDAPTIDASNTPQCKTFHSWSGEAVDVSEDMAIYAIWQDAHEYKITSFANGVADVTCDVCNTDSASLEFASHFNDRSTDAGYQAVLDVNKDGIINVKDFAMLSKGAY